MKKVFLYSVFTASAVFTWNANAANDCTAAEIADGNCWDCGKTENDSCTARLSGTTLSIVGTGEMKDYGWSSNKAPWDDKRLSVTKVEIGDGIKSIGAYTLDEMRNVTGDLVIPNSVMSIGANNITGMSSLTGLTVPEGLNLSWTRYQNLNSLTSLTISPEQMLYNESTSINAFEASICNFFYSAERCAEAAAYFEANPDARTYEFTEEKSILSRLPANLTINCRGSAEDCQHALEYANGTPTLNLLPYTKTNPDGSTTTYNPDGSTTINNSDGSTTINNSDGSTTSYQADGSTISHRADGSTTIYNASDGTTAIYDANGKLIGLKGKRIYSVNEASEIAGKKNKVMIRYK